jgi:hypothetical protein
MLLFQTYNIYTANLRPKLHQWLGRTIALLGIIQIPLGLTLYGSSLWLFVLYTLVTFVLLVIYFVLSYRRESRRGDSNYSYSSGTGSVVDEHRQTGRMGRLAEGAAAGAGLAALASRFRNRRERQDEPEVIGSRRHSGSYVEEEKLSQYSHDSGRQHRLRDKILGIGGIAAAAYWITRILGRKNEDHESEGTVTTEEDSVAQMERVEEGRQSRPIPTGPHPLSQPPMTPLQHRDSQGSVTEESFVSNENTGRRGHGLRDAVLGLGAIGLARNIFKKRREKKEDRRIQALREQEIEDERIARANSQRYTGDGAPPRRSGRRSNATESILDAAEEGRYTQGLPPPPPPGGTAPIVAGAAGAALAGAMLADHNRQGSAPLSSNPVAGGLPPPPPGPMLPLVPPGPLGAQQYNSSGSEMYTSVNGRTHRRHHEYDPAIAGAAGAAAGLVAGEALANRRDRTRDRHSASAGEESTGSGPPVSVKVKMHSDGRHVTLRRLPEEEAAAERAARRSSRDRNGQRRRGDSVSTLDGPDNGVGGGYYRRTEAMERQQANTSRERANLQAAQAQISQSRLAVPGPPPASGSYPPPPPIPQSSSPLGPPGSVSSPGAYDGTGTEASADYAINRKRRRAERAQAKAARADREGQAPMEYT